MALASKLVYLISDLSFVALFSVFV